MLSQLIAQLNWSKIIIIVIVKSNSSSNSNSNSINNWINNNNNKPNVVEMRGKIRLFILRNAISTYSNLKSCFWKTSAMSLLLQGLQCQQEPSRKSEKAEQELM